MYKVFPLVLLIMMVSFACQHKTAPASTAKTEMPATGSEPVITARTVEPPAPAKQAVVYASKDIEGGQLVYTSKCTKCHDAKPLQRWTVEEWQPILKSMIPKSKLDSLQKVQVRAYVEAFAKRP